MNGRIKQYLDFIVEIDKVKSIFRRSRIFDGTRYENDAEHSWTICVMAALFQEFSSRPVNLERVLLMLLLHDVVEVDAGDTFLYASDRSEAADRERKAAERIFGTLDDPHRDLFRGLWEEFEARVTPEAQYAAVFDRLEPLYQNYVNEGSTWKENGVKRDMVIAANRHIAEAAPEIWAFVEEVIEDAVKRGFLPV